MCQNLKTHKKETIRTHRLTFLNKSLESIDYDFMKKEQVKQKLKLQRKVYINQVMIKKPQGKVVSASMLTLTVLVGFSRGFEVFCKSSAEKTLFKAVLGTIN